MSQDPLVEERFQLVKGEYNKILKLVDGALTSEQNGDFNSALEQYNVVLNRMDTILGMNCSKVFSGSHLQDAIRYQSSLFDLKQNISESISRLSSKREPTVSSANANVSPPKSGEILFKIENDVQYYKVSSNGDISIPSYPSSLLICGAPDGSQDGNLKSILTVGDWSIELESGVTPVLITRQGIIMFIDQSAATQAYVGIILPPTFSNENRETLHSILLTLACVKIEGMQSVQTTENKSSDSKHEHMSQSPCKRTHESTEKADILISPNESKTNLEQPTSRDQHAVYTVAKNITSVSEKLGIGLIKGAESAGKALCHYSESVCKKIDPGDPSAPVDPTFQQAAHYIRSGSSGVVYVSGKLVDLVGKGAKKVGCAVAPTVRKGCDRILPESWLRADPNANNLSKLDQATIVAGASLSGLSQLWNGLEEGSKILGRHLVKGTSTVVRHKYGNDAGSTTTNVMYSAGNIGMTGYNVGYLGPKGIAKSLASETGRAVVEQYSADSGPSPPAYPTNDENGRLK